MTIEEREAPDFDPRAAEEQVAARGKTYIPQTCYVCGAGEDSRVLLPCRRDGGACGSVRAACPR